jgi:hypothetical protein
MGGGGSAAGEATGGGNGSAALGGIGFALQKLHRAGTLLAGRMEQTAAHGGMHGAYPYSTISGGQRIAPPRRGGGGAAGPGTAAERDAGEWPWDESAEGEGPRPGPGTHWPDQYAAGNDYDGEDA